MNKLNETIEKTEFKTDILYLLDSPDVNFGFFYQNGTVYFGKKSVSGTETESIDTSLLDMNLNIYIQSVESGNSFESGYYDLLAFKGELDGDHFDIFYNICVSYCQDVSDISFTGFFNALVDLFKKNKESIYKNLVGVIGELFLIKYCCEKYGINLSDNWHLTGSNSKFDFSLKSCNIEVKTTSKVESEFLLKHYQLFNNQNNYISVISIIETGEGESLQSLCTYFSVNEPFANNVKFQIALTRELLRVNEKKEKARSFCLDKLKIYSVKNMETIGSIPANISEVQYNYNFTDVKESNLEIVIKENF